MVRTGKSAELEDVDELLTAVKHGLLTPEVGEEAVQTAVAAVAGLARHDYHLERWLAEADITLSWRGVPRHPAGMPRHDAQEVPE